MSIDGREDDGRDVLVVSMTRPATFLNIPIAAAGLIMMAGMIAFGLTHNFLYGIAVALPAYLISLAIVRYDINAFTILGLYARCRFGPGSSMTGYRLWGGSTYSPTAISLARRKGFGHGSER